MQLFCPACQAAFTGLTAVPAVRRPAADAAGGAHRPRPQPGRSRARTFGPTPAGRVVVGHGRGPGAVPRAAAARGRAGAGDAGPTRPRGGLTSDGLSAVFGLQAAAVVFGAILASGRAGRRVRARGGRRRGVRRAVPGGGTARRGPGRATGAVPPAAAFWPSAGASPGSWRPTCGRRSRNWTCRPRRPRSSSSIQFTADPTGAHPPPDRLGLRVVLGGGDHHGRGGAGGAGPRTGRRGVPRDAPGRDAGAGPVPELADRDARRSSAAGRWPGRRPGPGCGTASSPGLLGAAAIVGSTTLQGIMRPPRGVLAETAQLRGTPMRTTRPRWDRAGGLRDVGRSGRRVARRALFLPLAPAHTCATARRGLRPGLAGERVTPGGGATTRSGASLPSSAPYFFASTVSLSGALVSVTTPNPSFALLRPLRGRGHAGLQRRHQLVLARLGPVANFDAPRNPLVSAFTGIACVLPGGDLHRRRRPELRVNASGGVAFTAPLPFSASVSTTGSPFIHTVTGLSDVFLISTVRSTAGAAGPGRRPSPRPRSSSCTSSGVSPPVSRVYFVRLAGDGQFQRRALRVGLRPVGLLRPRPAASPPAAAAQPAPPSESCGVMASLQLCR